MRPDSRRIQLNRPSLLLVEGAVDKAFFDALCQHLELHHLTQVVETKGKSAFKSTLSSLIIDPYFIDNVISVGLCMDADHRPKAAFDSLGVSCKRQKRVVMGAPGV